MIESRNPMVSPGVEAALTGETPTSSKDFIEAAMDYVQNDGGQAVFTREELEHESFDVREVVDFGQGRIEVHDEAAVLRMVEGGSPPIWAKALAPVSPEEAALAVIEPVAGDVSSLTDEQSSIVVLRVCRIRDAPTWQFSTLMAGVIGDALHGDETDGIDGSDLVMAWGADPDGTGRYPEGRSVHAALASGHADAGDGPYAVAAGVETAGMDRDFVNRIISNLRSRTSYMVNIVDVGQVTAENARIAKSATLVIALICNEDGKPLTASEKNVAALVWSLALTPVSMGGWGIPADRCVLVAPQAGTYPSVFDGQPSFGLPDGKWEWRPSDKNGRWDAIGTSRRWMRGMIETTFHGLGDYAEEALPPTSGVKGWLRVRKQRWEARKVQIADRFVPEIDETIDASVET